MSSTFIINPFTFGTSGKALTYIGETTDTTNTDVYTFSGESIGTAASDRRIHVLVMGEGISPSTLSSATVGGIAATINVQRSSGDVTAAIITAAVPTGTTADIVLSFSVVKGSANIGVYRSVGLTSNTAVDTDSSASDPATATLTSVAGGFCIGLCCSTVGTTVTWSGGVNEDYDVQPSANTASGASASTGGTSISPSGDYASGSGSEAACFATF